MYSATKCTASAREEKWERYRHSVFKLPKKLSITASAQCSYDACHDLPITLQVENAELLGMGNDRSDNCILWKNVARETWHGLPMPCCAHCARQGEQYGSTRRLETVEVKIALCRCEMDGQAIINSGSCWQCPTIQAPGNNITGPAARQQKKHRRVAGHLSFARTGNR